MRVGQAVETAYNILNCSKIYAVISYNVKIYWAAKAKYVNFCYAYGDCKQTANADGPTFLT